MIKLKIIILQDENITKLPYIKANFILSQRQNCVEFVLQVICNDTIH